MCEKLITVSWEKFFFFFFFSSAMKFLPLSNIGLEGKHASAKISDP